MSSRNAASRKSRINQLGLLMGMAIILAFAHTANAADNTPVSRGTKEEVVALVKRAIAHFNANGADKAFAAFNDPKGQLVDRDLYIIAMDSTGILRASGAHITLVGRNLAN
jgi:cytochrome c